MGGGNLLGIGTEVSSAKLVNDELKELKLLFKASPKSRGGRHFGSRLLLTNDNSLYITLGDRGEMKRAQNINDHAGSLIRINKDGVTVINSAGFNQLEIESLIIIIRTPIKAITIEIRVERLKTSFKNKYPKIAAIKGIASNIKRVTAAYVIVME